MGRSDLVRRAMSKKKGSVMEKERQNFVYGNLEEGVPGCVANGISEKVANHIYDEMIDFAKYAFNKSHAAAYAVVAYETAYLKYYYPVEFMAALMTSVIENSSKVSEYILSCRQMGIEIIPPDVNEGEANFSVSGNKIRYGLSAIKSIGKPVIAGMVKEREENGRFKNLKDFINRMSQREINKRVVENLIKSGAFDHLGATRKQMMMVYAGMMEQAVKEKKQSLAGQMSLFDFVEEDVKKDFEIKMPDVGEYDKDTILTFEKEVLGIYISGHPLEADEELLKKNITAQTNDFNVDEETGCARVEDGRSVVVGGMITAKTVKTTKTNQLMAFVTLEDLVGTLEIIIFPKDYEKYRSYLEVDKKVLFKGRVSIGDENQGKLVCERLIPFEDIPRELWLQYDNKEIYLKEEKSLLELLAPWDGNDSVIVYLKDCKQYKKLPSSKNIGVNTELLKKLYEKLGEKNVKVIEKSIEKL